MPINKDSRVKMNSDITRWFAVSTNILVDAMEDQRKILQVSDIT